jgi:PAT family beta-lactamase induction signal transducer AmpG
VRRNWWQALAVYGSPRVLSMLFLGFSAGLPFYLIYQTLSAWLRQAGIARATIAMLAWVGLISSLKFLWAPVVDRSRLPLLHRLLGRRRSWMLLAQGGLALGLVNLSAADPRLGVQTLALWTLFVAFCAATQDIAIDAWRIESAAVEMQGAMAAAYQMGYRAALIVGSAGALTLAARLGWHASYAVMAALVGVGVLTTLIIREPQAASAPETVVREQRVIAWLEARAHWPTSLQAAGGWVIGAVICPFADFVARYRAPVALLLVAFICSYRLTDYAMGSMANSFYIDHGYSLTQIATVVKLYGLPMGIVGVLLGGVLIARLGLVRTLVVGSVLIMCSNLGFAVLAATPVPTLLGLGVVNGFDNVALGVHGTALIAFLSSLTSARYTATQYALFSSLFIAAGKLLEGTSGFVVDAIGYRAFFIYTAALSLPALALLLVIRVAGPLAMWAVPPDPEP